MCIHRCFCCLGANRKTCLEFVYWVLKKLDLPSSSVYGFANRIRHDRKVNFVHILPLEILVEIFSKLILKDLLNVCLVSKSWYMVVSNPLVWKRMYQSQENWRFDSGRLAKSLISSSINYQIDWQSAYKCRYALYKNWQDGKCVKKVYSWKNDPHAHSDAVYAVKIDSYRSLMISGSRDCSIKIWNIKTRQCIKTLSHHLRSVLCLDADLDKNIIVSGSSDNTILVWNYSKEKAIGELLGHTGSVVNVKIYDNKYIISCSKDSSIRIWDLKTFQLLKILNGHTGSVNTIQIADSRIASASSDKTIKLWDINSGECIRTLAGLSHGVISLSFDGKIIVSGSSDRSIRTFDANTGIYLHAYNTQCS